MPSARQRAATSRPMRPKPTTPMRFPLSSTPANDFRSHFPAFMDASAWGMLRASASSSARLSSAVETRLPSGEFMTTTPRLVAAARSTLSTPTPGRPMMRRLFAASSTSAVIWLPLRIISAWYGPMIPAISAGGIAFLTSTSQPSALRTSRPRSVIPSSTRMRTLMRAPRPCASGTRPRPPPAPRPARSGGPSGSARPRGSPGSRRCRSRRSSPGAQCGRSCP